MPNAAVSADGSSLMTKLPKGIKWSANTAFTSDHVGKYVVTVITDPQACTLEPRPFTIELIECEADQLEIDRTDSVFKQSEPSLTYMLYLQEPGELNWDASEVISSNYKYDLC